MVIDVLKQSLQEQVNQHQIPELNSSFLHQRCLISTKSLIKVVHSGQSGYKAAIDLNRVSNTS